MLMKSQVPQDISANAKRFAQGVKTYKIENISTVATNPRLILCNRSHGQHYQQYLSCLRSEIKEWFSQRIAAAKFFSYQVKQIRAAYQESQPTNRSLSQRNVREVVGPISATMQLGIYCS